MKKIFFYASLFLPVISFAEGYNCNSYGGYMDNTLYKVICVEVGTNKEIIGYGEKHYKGYFETLPPIYTGPGL